MTVDELGAVIGAAWVAIQLVIALLAVNQATSLSSAPAKIEDLSAQTSAGGATRKVTLPKTAQAWLV